MRNIEKITAVGLILFFVGLSCGAVGEMPKRPATPYDWYLPLQMLVLMAGPAILAYRAGRKDGDAS